MHKLKKLLVNSFADSELFVTFANEKPATGNKNANLLLFCYQHIVKGGLFA